MNKNAQLVEQALKHEYAQVKDFVRALASYSTLENMGQSPDYRITGSTVKPQDVFPWAYNAFAQDASAEGAGVDEEYKDWHKKAEKIAVTLQKKKLALTVENGNHAWNKTGPFAKKA